MPGQYRASPLLTIGETATGACRCSFGAWTCACRPVRVTVRLAWPRLAPGKEEEVGRWDHPNGPLLFTPRCPSNTRSTISATDTARAFWTPYRPASQHAPTHHNAPNATVRHAQKATVIAKRVSRFFMGHPSEQAQNWFGPRRTASNLAGAPRRVQAREQRVRCPPVIRPVGVSRATPARATRTGR